MRISVRGRMLALVMVATLGTGQAQAQLPAAETAATPPAATTVKAKTKAKKKKAPKGAVTRSSTVKFMSGSAETPAERSARLKRECKGRVNAGACEGYTGSP